MGCERAMNWASAGGTSPAKSAGKAAGSRNRKSPSLVGPHVVVGGRRLAQEGDGALALVGDEGGDIDEADDVRRIARLGDHDAAIAVADQDRRALLQLQHPLGRRHVVGERGQRLLHHADRVAVLAQDVGDRAPARGWVERMRGYWTARLDAMEQLLVELKRGE